jgi:hypothetical protein
MGAVTALHFVLADGVGIPQAPRDSQAQVQGAALAAAEEVMPGRRFHGLLSRLCVAAWVATAVILHGRTGVPQ